ncbi:hypothetical protein FB565_002249 [Actinoplanes lutulentus]|uniref:GDSL-like lipase/acylhydrolase family protein n=1 Tax=Actinoplanes lutulentus TaxID=1287878 RepID=A0A327ZL47_9ACTN|nr:hypothetical protein [Actinoplanes lutulentus]MBB2942536.1 hypothetical protein [Actinoplanes lutulentus]RAK38117.1 hypothetical protein B0I29_10563 [Actinoplanes lutulentus]
MARKSLSFHVLIAVFSAFLLFAPVAPAQAALPVAAVALGDSFISGEGAGSYASVPDVNGAAQGFPGWSAANSNAYFCHRSANASIFRADLPGVAARFNLACSGGRPYDLMAASSTRTNGRQVTAQADQLRAVAQTHDIDLVLLGIGSNNSSFTFGDVAVKCANRFIADAWTGWWEFWAYINGPVPQEPCAADDLATAAQIASATAETVQAVRGLLTVLDEIDADGQHRVVLQDYTNPLPTDVMPSLIAEDSREDDRDKFRALGAERYRAGCPIHRASLPAGHQFSAALGSLVGSVHNQLKDEFLQLARLNVQHAFDGARLCESSTNPAATLATPIRVQDGPNGVFIPDLDGYDKIAIQRFANTCVTYYQTCQESWHPSAAGHGVLATCLTGAAASGARELSCVRNPNGTLTIS